MKWFYVFEGVLILIIWWWKMYKYFSNKYDKWASYYDPCDIEKKVINKYINLHGKKVIDIGCGTGRLTFYLSKFVESIIGIDIDRLSINYCNKKKGNNKSYSNCDFICADILDYNIYDLFDIAFFSWSLYQTADMEKALINSKNALTQKGELVILQPVAGDQDKIFNIEVNRTKKDYKQIIAQQLSICNNLFSTIYAEDIVTEFVYPSIDCAIKANSFFYDLFGEGVTEQVDNDLRILLSNHLDSNGTVHLQDVTKFIKCSK